MGKPAVYRYLKTAGRPESALDEAADEANGGEEPV
jgi:hypothetical protein